MGSRARCHGKQSAFPGGKNPTTRDSGSLKTLGALSPKAAMTSAWPTVSALRRAACSAVHCRHLQHLSLHPPIPPKPQEGVPNRKKGPKPETIALVSMAQGSRSENTLRQLPSRRPWGLGGTGGAGPNEEGKNRRLQRPACAERGWSPVALLSVGSRDCFFAVYSAAQLG